MSRNRVSDSISLGSNTNNRSSTRHYISSTSPRSEERREQMKNKRKEEQAEQFKQMHVLMNPLRTNEENESALKSLLGMKGKGYLLPHILQM